MVKIKIIKMENYLVGHYVCARKICVLYILLFKYYLWKYMLQLGFKIRNLCVDIMLSILL